MISFRVRRSTIVAIPAAVAAHHLQRPIRCMLDRDEDMILTGTRHPFMAKYKVGFTKEGRLIALEVEMYNNAGNTLDLSRSIMERAVFHIDNAYKIQVIMTLNFMQIVLLTVFDV